MKNYIKTLTVTALISAAFAGCVTNDDFNTPRSVTECVEPAVTANKTVADVVAATTSAVRQYAADDVIEAYVTSSDERGNFFKIVSLQTLPADGIAPIGFSVAIDANTLFGHGFYPGKKVYIKLKDLYYAKVEGSAIFGAAYRGSTGRDPITVGRIAESAFKKSVLPSCSEISEERLVRPLTVAQALNDRNVNTLIDLQNVQFTDEFVGATYYDEFDLGNTAGGATNRTLSDTGGNTVVFRTSSFANFSGNKISGKRGVVRGILTKYNGVFQFVARYESDIRLTQDRVDAAPPLVGNAITYGLYNENFSSYTVGARNFPNAINDAAIGSRYWQVKTFSANQYIEMTSFVGGSAPGALAKTYFMVPVDFTAATNFTFKKEIRFMAGQALKVYYVKAADYTPGGVADPATFTEITSSFTNLIYPAAGASQFDFTTAGTYNIPADLTGNGFFVFEYSGGGPVTTTIQLDDILVN